MNCYASLGELKAELGIAGTSRDAELLRTLEGVSRAFDAELNRTFAATVETRTYDGNGGKSLWVDDIASVTSIVVTNGSTQTTLTGTDYYLSPNNRVNSPVRRIDLAPSGTVSVWPLARQSVSITGIFGYSYEVQAVGQCAEPLDASETEISVDAGHGLTGGETIKIEDEQMYVSAVSTNVLTVVRGVNGTTAATHADDSAISKRRYPRGIERATVMQAARFSREVQTGYSGQTGNAEMGGYSFNASYPAIKDMIRPFHIVAVA